MPVFNNALAGAAGSAGGAAADFKIERSLRFNSADSAYLNKTFSVGNRKTWTWSGWVKLADLSSQSFIFGANGGFQVYYSAGKIYLDGDASVSSSNYWTLSTERVFRDPAAWYHFVFVHDTTEADANDRFKIYVNGVQVTEFSTNTRTNFIEDYEGHVNNNVEHRIGRQPDSSTVHSNLYLAEVHFIDGQALDETDFGEFDDNGVWQPKRYSGTRGTNGFYLDFSDNSTNDALGNDAAGSNDWDVNNLVATGSQDGISATAPQGSGGDWAGVVGFTPSNTNGSVATLPDGGGQDNTNGRFYWSGLSVGDTITLHLTTGSDTSNRSVFGDVDESTTGGSPGSTLGTITLTASAASGSAKIDFNGTASIYGITPGPIASRYVDDCRDSPTNYDDGTNIGGNYATMNALHKGYTSTLSNGNLFLDNSGTGTTWSTTVPTIGVTSGKWYAELTVVGTITAFGVGVSALETAYVNSYHGQTSDSYCWFGPGNGLYTGGQYTNTAGDWVGSFSSGDVIGLALDMDNGTLRYYKNGNLLGGGDAFTGITGEQFFATCSHGHREIWNFGQHPFAHTPPTGYKALCTQNFDDPSIEDGSQHMDVLLWSGDTTSAANAGDRPLTSLNMSPDLVWIKQRNQEFSTGHQIYDSVRGSGSDKELDSSSNQTEGQGNIEQYGWLNSFDSNGFTVRGGSVGNTYVNASGTNYCAWTWDAGDLAASSAFNQSQVWSSGTQTNPDTARPLINLFDNDTATLIAAASGNDASSKVTLPASITAQTSVRYWSRAGGYNNGPTTLSNSGTTVSTIAAEDSQSSGWKSFTGTFPMTFNEITFNRSSDGTGSGAAAIEVDGKVLVDKGLIPAGSLNSSSYNQSQTWSTYGTFDNNWSNSAYHWDDVFNTTMANNGDGSLYVDGTTKDTWNLSSPVAVSNTIKVYTQGLTEITINEGLSDETISTSTDNQGNFHYHSFSFTGNVESVGVRHASGNSIYFMGIWFDGKQLVDDTETPTNVPLIASTNRTKPSAGFSIISASVNSGLTAPTLAHGLNKKPEFIIGKNRDSTIYSYVYHKELSNNYYIDFGTGVSPTTEAASDAVWGGHDALDSQVFQIGIGTPASMWIPSGTENLIFWAWTGVEGFSKFDSYIANAGNDGPWVFTGFRPRWIMIKHAKGVANDYSSWLIVDTERDTYNVSDAGLFANDPVGEGTRGDGNGSAGTWLDILSNGFKIRYNGTEVNGSNGDRYIYAAFAENPFKYSRAR